MPIKKTPNQVILKELKMGEILSFFTLSRKSHFDSESRLYETLENTAKSISNVFTVHLTTYPFIAVHVVCGDTKELANKSSLLKSVIQNVLTQHLR